MVDKGGGQNGVPAEVIRWGRFLGEASFWWEGHRGDDGVSSDGIDLQGFVRGNIAVYTSCDSSVRCIGPKRPIKEAHIRFQVAKIPRVNPLRYLLRNKRAPSAMRPF